MYMDTNHVAAHLRKSYNEAYIFHTGLTAVYIQLLHGGASVFNDKKLPLQNTAARAHPQ